MNSNSLYTKIIQRDGQTCLVPGCINKDVSTHKLIHGSLWSLGGKVIKGDIENNVVLLCKFHKRHADKGYFPPQACRMWAGIERELPEQLDKNFWFTVDGSSIISPDEVAPNIPYLQGSPGIDHDNTTELRHFINKPLIITVDMDGITTSLRKDRLPLFIGAPKATLPYLLKHVDYTKGFDDDIEVFAKWLLVTNKIHYTKLKDYLQVFAAYSHKNEMWLSWDAVTEIAAKMYTSTVHVLYKNIFNSTHKLHKHIKNAANKVFAAGQTGLVVRSTYPFHYGHLNQNVGRYISEDYYNTKCIYDSGRHNILKNATSI